MNFLPGDAVMLLVRQFEDGPWLARVFSAEEAAFAILAIKPRQTRYSDLDGLVQAILAESERVLEALLEAGIEPLVDACHEDMSIVIDAVLKSAQERGLRIIARPAE